MRKRVTLDSSVLVSAFVGGEAFRPIALQILRRIFLGEFRATTSAIVPVEVCGAISRRSGIEEASLVKRQLEKWEGMGFIAFSALDRGRMREAVELALRLRLKGMDAIVVQVAKEEGAALVTFDEEVARRAKEAVEVLTHGDLGR
ncbi:MAG: PIN domain-containing protein [Candidatus Bathyarchaeia archaeon]